MSPAENKSQIACIDSDGIQGWLFTAKINVGSGPSNGC